MDGEFEDGAFMLRSSSCNVFFFLISIDIEHIKPSCHDGCSAT